MENNQIDEFQQQNDQSDQGNNRQRVNSQQFLMFQPQIDTNSIWKTNVDVQRCLSVPDDKSNSAYINNNDFISTIWTSKHNNLSVCMPNNVIDIEDGMNGLITHHELASSPLGESPPLGHEAENNNHSAAILTMINSKDGWGVKPINQKTPWSVALHDLPTSLDCTSSILDKLSYNETSALGSDCLNSWLNDTGAAQWHHNSYETSQIKPHHSSMTASSAVNSNNNNNIMVHHQIGGNMSNGWSNLSGACDSWLSSNGNANVMLNSGVAGTGVSNNHLGMGSSVNSNGLTPSHIQKSLMAATAPVNMTDGNSCNTSVFSHNNSSAISSGPNRPLYNRMQSEQLKKSNWLMSQVELSNPSMNIGGSSLMQDNVGMGSGVYNGLKRVGHAAPSLGPTSAQIMLQNNNKHLSMIGGGIGVSPSPLGPSSMGSSAGGGPISSDVYKYKMYREAQRQANEDILRERQRLLELEKHIKAHQQNTQSPSTTIEMLHQQYDLQLARLSNLQQHLDCITKKLCTSADDIMTPVDHTLSSKLGMMRMASSASGPDFRPDVPEFVPGKKWYGVASTIGNGSVSTTASQLPTNGKENRQPPTSITDVSWLLVEQVPSHVNIDMMYAFFNQNQTPCITPIHANPFARWMLVKFHSPNMAQRAYHLLVGKLGSVSLIGDSQANCKLQELKGAMANFVAHQT